MHGVKPGDVLRLNRASGVGSRDWTLLGERNGDVVPGDSETAAAMAEGTAAATEAMTMGDDSGGLVVGTTAGLIETQRPGKVRRPGPIYVDERLFVCRATVLGTESEPMRVKVKTKQRQRREKRVKSKHQYTVLRIGELRVRTPEELSAEYGGFS
ncbi:hypothetical protein MRB53_036951 [Persea americana]|nr:hypothetical protein MRB53_036951 [Persea americana]